MPRLATAVFSALLLTAALPAWADGAPDAAKIRTASEQFEVGALAYKKGSFEEAASAFEAADDSAPSVKPLKLAIKSRDQAGQGSRGATLAALAMDRYPGDADIGDVARRTLEKLSPLLHKVTVSCGSPCVLAAGPRAIHGQADTRWTVYLDPGKTTISASFFGNTVGVKRDVDAKAGGTSAIRFEPPEAPRAAVAPGEKPSPAGKLPHETVSPIEPVPDEPEKPKSGLPPAVVAVGAIATAGLLGATIWSGIDTKNNPGPDAVRAACAGKTSDCPEYAAGRAHQTRTNILLGATIGTAVITGLIGIAFTRWGGKKKADAALTVAPTAVIVDRGGGAGVALRF